MGVFDQVVEDVVRALEAASDRWAASEDPELLERADTLSTLAVALKEGRVRLVMSDERDAR